MNNSADTSDFKAPERILVIRTDRLGDVILSTPVLTVLREQYPDCHLAMMVAPYTRDIIEGHPALDHILIDDANDTHKGLPGFFRLVKDIHKHGFDAVIILHPTARLAMACRLAGVPNRIGTGYRGYSLLFNNRVFEHRKAGNRHEVDYNSSLVRALTKDVTTAVPNIQVPDESRDLIKLRLIEWGIGIGPFVVLHPGSGGSARDWPASSFAALGSKLIASGIQIIMTGGVQEHLLIKSIVKSMPDPPIIAVGMFSVKQLAALLDIASLCITNSTGPLHISAALNTPTISLFCPIIPCSPTRWGPVGDIHTVMMPDVPPCPRCIEEACPYFDCMTRISVDAVYTAVREIMETITRR